MASFNTTKELTEFQPPNTYETNRNSTFKWILSHVFRFKIFFIPILVLQFLASIFQSIVPIFIGLVVDAYLNDSLSTNKLITLCVLILVAGVGAAVFNLIKAFMTEVLAQGLERNSRDELYSSLIGKSLTFHDDQAIGDLMARASTDVRHLNLMLNPGFLLVFTAATGIAIPYLFIFLINPQLLFIPILFLVTYLLALRVYNRKLGVVAYRQRVINSQINSKLNEVISGMYLVRGMSQEQKEQKYFNKIIEEYKSNVIEQGEVMARYYPLLLLGIATVFSLFHGLVLVDNGTISAGNLIAFIALIQLLRFPTFINIFAFTLLSLGVASARRILQLINAETNIDSNLKGYNEQIKGKIEFNNVTFGYNETKPVVNNVTFNIEPGQTVALIGMTGSGKTTLTKLITRLYDPQHGSICIDDVDIRNWSIEGLRSQIALVEQDIFLFSKSIRDNIRFGNQTATTDEILNAAKLAQAHRFISELPKGYDTVIGERGITLSGGQRQRIAIARAILRNPRILILDDASSAIDSQTEDEIQQAIKSVLRGRVSFLITHRIAQIQRADLIVLLDKGEIIGSGTHNELLTDNVDYKKIFTVFDDQEVHGLESKEQEVI